MTKVTIQGRENMLDKKFLSIILALFLLCNSSVSTADLISNFELPVSGSLGLGNLMSSDFGVPNRTMNSVSFEALPSYKLDQFMFGPHFDLRWQGQLTALSDAGGMNWRGNGYLIGLGVRYAFSETLFAQASFDFLGEYRLAKQTINAQDDHLHSPSEFRIKLGYAPIENLQNLSIDLDLQYLLFNKLQVAGVDLPGTSRQLMASVGVTCLLPCWTARKNEPKPNPEPEQPVQTPQPAAAPSPQQEEELASVVEVKRVGDSLQLILSGANFDVASASLSEEGEGKLQKIAESLSKFPEQKIRIEGHTDSTGNLEKNMKLSEDRANTVKSFLSEHGVAAERLTATGFGPNKPVAPNETKKGRALNRRIELFVEQKSK